MRAEPVCSVAIAAARSAGGLTGLRTDRGEGVRVLLLRHERARAAVRVGELDAARTPGWRRSRSPGRAGSDGSPRSRAPRAARRTRRPATRRPSHARPARRSRAARQGAPGRAPSASRRCRRRRRRSPRARRATRAHARRRAGRDRRTPGAGGRPSSAGPAGDRCSRWRAQRGWRCAWRTSAAAWSTSASCSSRTALLAVRRSATRKASRRGRPALSQPAADRPTRRSSSASRALNASPSAGSHGNSSPGIACSSSSPRRSARRVVTGEVAALDQRDGVRQIGEREPVREPRAMRALGGVRRRHQLAGRAAPQPSAAAQLLGLRHRPEPREMGGTGPERACSSTVSSAAGATEGDTTCTRASSSERFTGL